MTSSAPSDAAAVWQLRTTLKPHYRDGLVASADSDYHVVLVSLRAASYIKGGIPSAPPLGSCHTPSTP